jgi:hypothetical protein
MIYKLSPSWVWQDTDTDKGNNDMQESAFILAYCYLLLRKQYEVFSDCLNQHSVEVLAFCISSTDHPFAFYVQLRVTDGLTGASHLPESVAILTCT